MPKGKLRDDWLTVELLESAVQSFVSFLQLLSPKLMEYTNDGKLSLKTFGMGDLKDYQTVFKVKEVTYNDTDFASVKIEVPVILDDFSGEHMLVAQITHKPASADELQIFSQFEVHLQLKDSAGETVVEDSFNVSGAAYYVVYVLLQLLIEAYEELQDI